MQSHPQSWVLPETPKGCPHSQSLEDEEGHLCGQAPGDVAISTPETGLRRPELLVPLTNELASRASSTRSVEIEFNPLGGQNCFQQGLIRQAQQVLKSALVNATQSVPLTKIGLALDERVEPSESVSPEFLTWMLQGRSTIPAFRKLNSHAEAICIEI